MRYVLDGESTHFAILFNNQGLDDGIVIDASFAGTRLQWLSDFKKRNRIIKALSPNEAYYIALSSHGKSVQKTANRVFKNICDEFHGTKHFYIGA
jgi:hypothetical protein